MQGGSRSQGAGEISTPLPYPPCPPTAWKRVDMVMVDMVIVEGETVEEVGETVEEPAGDWRGGD